jgi:hypothetical protein
MVMGHLDFKLLFRIIRESLSYIPVIKKQILHMVIIQFPRNWMITFYFSN